MNIKDDCYPLYSNTAKAAAAVENMQSNYRCSEETAALILIATQIGSAVEALKEISAEQNDNFEMIADRISDTQKTLFDTLGSHKTGCALDALAELPGAIREATEDDDWLNDPEWLKEGRYIILDHKPTAEDFAVLKQKRMKED